MPSPDRCRRVELRKQDYLAKVESGAVVDGDRKGAAHSFELVRPGSAYRKGNREDRVR